MFLDTPKPPAKPKFRPKVPAPQQHTPPTRQQEYEIHRQIAQQQQERTAPTANYQRHAGVNRAREQATRANLPNPDMSPLFGGSAGRPVRFFGSTRPAPIASQKFTSDAQLSGGDHASIVPLAQFAATQQKIARMQDMFGGGPENSGVFGGVHGKDLFKPHKTNEQAFNDSLTKNPAYRAAVNDPQHGFENVATASAFGLPVGTDAASKYITGALQAAASGVDVSKVPGLVINDGATQQNVANIQAAVREKGFSKADVDKMNFGELMGHLAGNDKYTNWFGYKYLPTVVNNLAGSGSKAVIGFPAWAAEFGAGAGRDVRNDVGAVAHGNFGDITARKTWELGIKPATVGMYDFGKQIYNHPYETTSQDPVGTGLFLWTLLHGGAGKHGAGRFMEQYKRRQVELTHFRNEGAGVAAGENPMPEGPLTIPHTEIAPPPPGGPTPGIEPPMGPSSPSAPIIDRRAGLPSGDVMGPGEHPSERVTRMADQMRAANMRMIESAKERAVAAKEQAAQHPAAKKAAIATAEQAIKEMDYHLGLLKDQLAKLPTHKELSGSVEQAQARYEAAKQQLARADTPEKAHIAQQGMDYWQRHIEDPTNFRRTQADMRTTIKREIRRIRDAQASLHDEIVGHKIDLNLPIENSSRIVKGLRRQLTQAIKRQRPQAELQALKDQITNVQKSGQPDPYLPFKNAATQMPDEAFIGHPDPLTPIEHAADAFQANYESNHYDPLNHDSEAMVQDMMKSMHDANYNVNADYAPGSRTEDRLTYHIQKAAEKWFRGGENLRNRTHELTTEDKRRAKGFIQEAHDLTLQEQRSLEAAHADAAAVDNGAPDMEYERYLSERKKADEARHQEGLADWYRNRKPNESFTDYQHRKNLMASDPLWAQIYQRETPPKPDRPVFGQGGKIDYANPEDVTRGGNVRPRQPEFPQDTASPSAAKYVVEHGTERNYYHLRSEAQAAVDAIGTDQSRVKMRSPKGDVDVTHAMHHDSPFVAHHIEMKQAAAEHAVSGDNSTYTDPYRVFHHAKDITHDDFVAADREFAHDDETLGDHFDSQPHTMLLYVRTVLDNAYFANNSHLTGDPRFLPGERLMHGMVGALEGLHDQDFHAAADPAIMKIVNDVTKKHFPDDPYLENEPQLPLGNAGELKVRNYVEDLVDSVYQWNKSKDLPGDQTIGDLAQNDPNGLTDIQRETLYKAHGHDYFVQNFPGSKIPGEPTPTEEPPLRNIEAPPPEPIPTEPQPGTDVVPHEDNLPKSQREVGDVRTPMSFEFNPDDGSHALPSGPGTDLVKAETYRNYDKTQISEPLKVDRGFYSNNAIDRMFQWAADKTLESKKLPFSQARQERFLQKNYGKGQGHVRRRFYVWRDELNGLVKSAEKLNDAELTAIVQAHAQGVKPSMMLKMYQKLQSWELDKLEKLNFPPRLRQALQDRAPTHETLRQTMAFINDAAEKDSRYIPIRDWFRDYQKRIQKGDYVDDTLFGNIVKNFFEPSFDLRANIALWERVVHHAGDDMTPQMKDTLNHMRVASKSIDDVLAENNVLPREVMDNRRYQRQQIVSSILGEHVPLDDNAIYVPDRSRPASRGENLFRRARSTNYDKEFGGRVKKHRGSALILGRVDPSFANYYTGLTGAMSKVDAVKFQVDMLKKYAIQPLENQTTYDGNKFVAYDHSKGVPVKEILTRAVISELTNRMGGATVSRLTNEQRMRYRDERNPGGSLLQMTPDQVAAARRGDLHLIPRPIWDSMNTPITGATFQKMAPRLLQHFNVAFRTVALKLRPAYLPVNTAESAWRAMAWGGVNPISVAMDVAGMSGRRLGRALGVPDSVLAHGPHGFMQKIEAAGYREKLAPEAVKRTTFSGNIIKNPKLGSFEPVILKRTRQTIHDTAQRLDRSPTFGQPMVVARFVAGGYGDHIFSNTARAENYMREMMIFQKLLREARRQSYKGYDPRRYVTGINDHMLAMMEKIKNGEDVTNGGYMDSVVNEVYKILGDFSGAENKFAVTAMPFYRWTAFITKFVLWESPIHYPGRSLIMHQLGGIGMHQLSAMGLLPQNIQGAYPVGKEYDQKSDDPNSLALDKLIRVMYTQAWNGPSTVVNLLGIDPQRGTLNFGPGVARQLSPFFQAAFAGAYLHDVQNLRELQNQMKVPLHHDVGNSMRIFTADMLKAFWPVVSFGGFDYGTMSDNSVPIFDMLSRKESLTGQPQSSPSEQLAAALFGTRRRPLNLSKLQQQNFDQAFIALRQMRKSLGDPKNPDVDSQAQTNFDNKFSQYLDEQLQTIDQWIKVNGDPSVFNDAAETADVNANQ